MCFIIMFNKITYTLTVENLVVYDYCAVIMSRYIIYFKESNIKLINILRYSFMCLNRTTRQSLPQAIHTFQEYFVLLCEGV